MRIVVAMSGGVDSSVAAYLLKKEGYDVIGLTMRLPTGAHDDEESCCGVKGIEDARSVADHLDIPFYVVNYKDKFDECVVEYFCNEYKKGRTPNPCVVCNNLIKFGCFLDKARELDAEYIATGHYADVEYDDKTKRYLLKKGIDSKKDQSYFLFGLNQKQLSHTMFPLAKLTKQEVRKIAKNENIPVFDKEESQEICFVPNDDYVSFLKDKGIKEGFSKGRILYKDGQDAGEHNGIATYTIGQRKGIGSHKSKYYVVDINVKDNNIVIDEQDGLLRDRCIVDNLNWISIDKLNKEMTVKARIRYKHEECDAKVIPVGAGPCARPNDKVEVVFKDPQRAITPGQFMVFYDGDVVIGGGVIQN